MKILFYLMLFICITLSCNNNEKEAVFSKLGNSNSETLNKLSQYIVNVEEEEHDIRLASKRINKDLKVNHYNKRKVLLYNEFLNLFDPDNFNCGCDEKMKKALKKIKHKNQDTPGFIPDVVIKNTFWADSVYLLGMRGGNILVHLFEYQNGEKKSKHIYAKNAPTVEKYNELEYFDKTSGGFDNFIYSLDCSGFITAAISASGGVNTGSITSAASVSSSSQKSLFVAGGVVYTPLYQAYKGTGVFSENIEMRIKELEAILIEIPEEEQRDDTQIIIDANYLVILTSNSGKSSFNGEGSLNASGNASFGFASVDGKMSMDGKINRNSGFSSYNTYIVDKNINEKPSIITIKKIKDLISSLKLNIT